MLPYKGGYKMNVMTKRGSLDNVVTYEHFCDTKADLANIPKEQITLGSVAIVLKDEGNAIGVYIADSSKSWVAMSTSMGGASANSIHICSNEEYDAEELVPTIEEPEENVFYLVPTDEENGNLFNEWIYVDENWEKFGASTNIEIPQPDWEAASGASGYINNKPAIRQYLNGGIIEGDITTNTASGSNSHAEGYLTTASGSYSHAEGGGARATGDNSHAEGSGAQATGACSHAEGTGAKAIGDYSHAEGSGSQARGNYSHAEGGGTTASGVGSHTEGSSTTASNNNSHAEGGGTTASGEHSHAEGSGTQAIGNCSHAEGSGTQAIGSYSHAEGGAAYANGDYSHAEGYRAYANGIYSHAEGNFTYAQYANQHVFGAYNILDSITNGNSNSIGNYIEIVGNGTDSYQRSNARTLDWSGNEWLAGNLTAAGGSITIGSTTVTEQQLQALLALLS